MHDVLCELLHRRQISRFVCFAAMAVMLWGCGRSGPKYWAVDGKVTFQGKPVTAGSIRFSNPRMGVDIVTELDAGGNYAIVTGEKMGLPEGTYQVAVVPKVDISNLQITNSGLVVPSSMPSTQQRHPPNIPIRYHQPATSGLTLTVKPEPNVFDVDMQSTK